jgi:hypothetical protein
VSSSAAPRSAGNSTYLVALNIIAAHYPGTTEVVLEVLLYNLIWFALPIGALAICVVRPSAARDVLQVWRGPESNRRHHDFQSLPKGVVWCTRVCLGLVAG